MKKLVLLAAFAGLFTVAVANTKGDDKGKDKKECAKKDGKACCKKEGKACCKKDAETKSTEEKK
ncbi:MAG: hypothetical protein JSU07_03750 [Bacteroidetes bacterium]|nr:hypothetical protein [Bacteroidota bacterium]